jgi:release factor glutamine methyltransferase
MTRLVDVLQQGEAWLRKHGVDRPRFEVELMLAAQLGVRRLDLYLSFDRPMSKEELVTLRAWFKRRGAREPLAWILGSVGFHGIDLDIRPGVLVPRPDTEVLVDAALHAIGPADATANPVYVADVGSGSGAVGLAIAAARPQVRLYATDIDPTALALTRHNAEKLGLTPRVAVLAGPLLSPIPEARPIDWVVSNPPYIPTRDIDGLMPEVSRWEPRLALDGGRDGLDVYHQLLPAALRRARQGCLVELGYDQGDALLDLFTKTGWADVRAHLDLEGHRRVIEGRIPAASLRS